jgi:hypothetical protein
MGRSFFNSAYGVFGLEYIWEGLGCMVYIKLLVRYGELLPINVRYCTCCYFGAGRNDFDVGNIHYEGHWEGWALKSRLFWGPEMATSKASII